MSDTEDIGELSPSSTSNPQITVGVDHIPDAVLIASAETSRIVEVNTAAEELFNCDSSDLIGCHQTELHPTDKNDAYIEAFQRGLAENRVNRLQSGEPLLIETVNGTRVPVEITVEQLTNNEKSYLMGVFREVSAQLIREQGLKQTASRLETLLNVLPTPVTVIDTNGEVKRWNQAAEQVLGYASEEIIGQPYQLFTDNKEFNSVLEQVLAGKEIRSYETTLRARDGSQLPVSINAQPIYENGSVSGVVGTAVDLSDSHQLNQQLDVLHRVARHNLRNELSVVKGWAELLEDTGDNSSLEGIDLENATEKIISSSNRLLKLSEGIIDIQKIVSIESQELKSQNICTFVLDLSKQLQMNRNIDKYNFAKNSVSGQVPQKAATEVLYLFENLLNWNDKAVLDIEIDATDNYLQLQVISDISLSQQGERALIQLGTETALQHARGIEIARAYLTIQSLGGMVELTCGPTGVPAADLQIEIPQIDN